MKKQKIESQETKYDKAQGGILFLLEQVISNLDSKVERRLNQDKVQNVKKYYFEEYRYFLDMKFLLFATLFSFLILSVAQGNSGFFGENPYPLLAIFVIINLALRYMYDEAKSTYIYIRKLAGRLESEDHDPSEIIGYLEKKIFMQNFQIRHEAYIIIAVLSSIILSIGSFFDIPKLMGIIVLVSFICLIEAPFVKIKKYKRIKKNDN